jgi:hypothetical protein
MESVWVLLLPLRTLSRPWGATKPLTRGVIPSLVSLCSPSSTRVDFAALVHCHILSVVQGATQRDLCGRGHVTLLCGPDPESCLWPRSGCFLKILVQQSHVQF